MYTGTGRLTSPQTDKAHLYNMNNYNKYLYILETVIPNYLHCKLLNILRSHISLVGQFRSSTIQCGDTVLISLEYSMNQGVYHVYALTEFLFYLY